MSTTCYAYAHMSLLLLSWELLDVLLDVKQVADFFLSFVDVMLFCLSSICAIDTFVSVYKLEI